MEHHRSLELYFIVAIAFIALVIILTVTVKPVNTSNSVDGCMGIVLSSYRDNCILLLAENTSSIQLCNNLPSPINSQCVLYIAENTSNVTACKQAGTAYYSSCVSFIAASSNSSKYCSYINDSSSALCASSVAIKTENDSACNYTSNYSDSSLCSSSLDLYLASKTGNASYCTNLSNVENTSYTSKLINYSSISTLVSNNSLSLELISPITYLESIQNLSISPSGLCYFSAADTSKNTSLCNKIENQTAYNICISSISQNNSTISGTESNKTSYLNISDNKTLSTEINNFNYSIISKSCYNYTQGDYGYCSEISSIIKAVTTKNLSYCPNQNTQILYQCYYVIAKAYNNTLYCSYIHNATENNNCISAITQNLTQ